MTTSPPSQSPPSERPPGKRKKRFRREPEGRLQITERDLDIIRQVFRHRFLRSTHLQALFGGGQGLLRRLAELYHHAFLDRPREPIEFYTTRHDFSYLRQPYPIEVVQTRLLSADQDLDPRQIPWLVETYQAAAVDWESGAIAWTAARSGRPCLVLRGVTDLVSPEGGESYDLLELYHQRTDQVMPPILESLPAWLEPANL